MREGITGPDIALLLGSGLRFFRVRVKRPEEVTWTNLSDLAGGDWVLSIGADGENPDQPATGFSFSLVHTEGDSLSPGDSSSPHNYDVALEFRPLIHPGRDVEISVAVIASGTPISGDWKPWLRGKIEDVDWPGAEVVASCLTLDGVLVQTQIEAEEEYPLDSVEDTIQALLDRWMGAGVVPLRVIGTPGWNVATNTYPTGSLGDQLLTLAQENGWDLRYRWSSSASDFRLTLYEPPRDKTTPDLTLTAAQVYDVPGLQESRKYVRNAFTVSYRDAGTGLRDEETGEEPDSIDEYGRQFMLIVEADESAIDSAARAAALIDFAKHDLAFPPAEGRYSIPFIPWLELGDLIEVEADGQHFDFDATFGVTGLAHQVSGESGAATTFEGRGGGPVGQTLGWFRRSVRRVAEDFEVDAVPSIDEDDGTFFLYPNRRIAAAAVYYTVTTDGTEPADPLGPSEVGGPVGSLSTADEISLGTLTVDGQVIRAKVKAVANLDGSGSVGPVREARATYHAGDDRPIVSWLPFQPVDTAKEGIRFVARDDGPTVDVGYAVVDTGDPEPTWPGDFTRTGLVSDPATIQAEVLRPAEGAPAKLVYYQAEDAAGNLAFEKSALVKVDGNRVPSGWIDYPVVDAGGLPKVIPNTDDSDTGSFRFRVKKTVDGDDTFDAPTFTDVDPDEFSGNAFGLPLDLDDTHRVVAGEQLNIAAYFFRTTSSTAATQSGSIRSELITLQIRPNSMGLSNAIAFLGGSWSSVGPSPVTTLELWKYMMNLSPGAGVQSMHVLWNNPALGPGFDNEYDQDLTGSGLYTLGVDGDATTQAELLSDVALHIELTPYDDAGGAAGSGVAGPPTIFEVPSVEDSGVGTQTYDRDDTFRTTDALILAAATVAQPDAVTGRTKIGFLVDASVFGVKADGTNQGTKIANAVNYAEALTGVGKGGARVILPDGTVWADQVRLKTRVSLEAGFNWNSELKQLANQHTVVSSGTATSGGVDTLGHTGAGWTVDEHIGRTVRITSGTGSGQARRIQSNTASQLVIEQLDPWATNPASGSGYTIYTPKHFVVLDSGQDTEHARIIGITIDGNKANQLALNDGIHLDQDDTGGHTFETNDPNHVVRDVKIRNCAGNGLYADNALRGCVFDTIKVQSCGMWGVEARATDNHYENIAVESSRLDGFRADDWGSMWRACKAFGCRSGWLLTQAYSNYVACWAQENKKNGFHLLNAHQNVFSGCMADKNGTDGDTYSAGFMLEEQSPATPCTGNVLSGCVGMCTPGGAFGATQRHAINNGAGTASGRACKGNWIEVACLDQTVSDLVGAFEGNTVVITTSDQFTNNRFAEFVTDKIISRSGTAGSAHNTEHIAFGRELSPAASNPQFIFKTTDDAVPKGVLLSWDGTTARTFLEMDHGNQRLTLGPSAGRIDLIGNVYFPTDATYDIGASGAGRPRDIWTSRHVRVGSTLFVTGGGEFGGTVISTTTNEAFKWGKTGMGTSGNPYYVFKHDNGSPPVATVGSWDGSTARTFFYMDHGNDRLDLAAGTVRWRGKDISEGAADSGGSGFKQLIVPN